MLVAGVVIGVFTDAASGREEDEAEKGSEEEEEDKVVEETRLGEEQEAERRGGRGTPTPGKDPKACWTLSPEEN